MDYHNHYIESYVHHGRIGVLVEFDLQDQVSTKLDSFSVLAKDIAMHIAASGPASVEDLLSQAFVKDESITVGELIRSVSKELRENISVIRFARWDTEYMPPRCPESPEPPRNPAVVMRIRGV